MTDRFQAITEDNQGVSPVIGVILMVAITAILAAVIGTFVLGLGDSLEQAPQSQLSADSSADNSISITHNGGDPLLQSDITINVNGEDYTSEFYSDTDEFSVGGELSNADSEYPATATVTVIHDSSESILLETDVNVQGITSTATATPTPTPTPAPTPSPTSTPE